MKPTRPVLAVVGLLTAGLAASAISTASAVDPVSAHLQRPLVGVDSGTFPGSEVPLGDRDDRGPRKAPLPGAVAAVAGLGGGVVSWNQYGTPRQTPNAQQVTITELQAFGAVTTLVAAPAAVPVAADRASLPATGAEVALAVFGILLIGIAIVVARRMRS